MTRRSFLARLMGALAATPCFITAGESMAALPVRAAAAGAIIAEELDVTESAASFPIFWDEEIVRGILAVPLLDILVADESGL